MSCLFPTPTFYAGDRVRFGTLVAKRLILNDWKATDPPSFSRWLREMVSGMQLERLHSSRSTITSVDSDCTWGPIIEHINFLAG